MRKAFVATLLSLAEEKPELVLVTGDLGYSVFEPFMQKRPSQYINAGIAEADMVGMCAGLALCGKRPIAYSITPFITMRPYEQVRLDVCYHGLPVVLVASGAGLAYGTLGPTHHGTEDIAAMRALPNMTVVAPCDSHELSLLLRQAMELGSPCYVRMGRGSEPDVYPEGDKPQVRLGKAQQVASFGEEFAIIACGNIVKNSLDALSLLHAQGKNGSLYSMHTIKPLDSDLVLSLAEKMPIFTVEEHSIIGGLGSAVAECLSDAGVRPAAFARIALPDSFQKKIGAHDFLRGQCGLLPSQIASTVSSALAKVKK